MKKVVLVTGASGFLGGRLCHELFKQGYHVKAFVRKTSDVSDLPPPTQASATGGSFQFVYGDVTDYQSLVEAFSGVQVVFHTAALVDTWLPNPDQFFTVNVGGLRNILKAYKETSSIEKIIYTSSFFALGATDGYIADETQMHPGKFFCSQYEKSKAVSDKVALDAAAEGVPIILAYPGTIYGPGKVTSGNVLANMLVERFTGKMPGYLGRTNGFSLVHVDDVVQGHIAAMTKGKAGERYLFTGENASLKQVFDIAAEISNTSKPKFRIPLFLIGAYGYFSIFLYKISGKKPLISPEAVDILKHQWAYSCEKAKRELGYNPRSLREGVAEMLPWLKNKGLIKY